MSTCHCTLTSRLLSKTHSASKAIPSASETAGGDAASKEVVIEADTSVPGGDAVSERIMTEGRTSVLGGRAALEGVAKKAEVARIGAVVNMLGHDAADDAIDQLNVNPVTYRDLVNNIE